MPLEPREFRSVRAAFRDPIDIDITGLVLSGTLEAVSSCESVRVGACHRAAPLRTGRFAAAAESTAGGSAGSRRRAGRRRRRECAAKRLPDTYIQSGTYVAQSSLSITVPGDPQQAPCAVDLRTVWPTVDAGGDIVPSNEGELVTLVFKFLDVGTPTLRDDVVLRGPPAARFRCSRRDQRAAQRRGNVDGDARVVRQRRVRGTLRVRDQNGGIGEYTLTVTVLTFRQSSMPVRTCSRTRARSSRSWPIHRSGLGRPLVGTWEFGDCTGDRCDGGGKERRAGSTRHGDRISHLQGMRKLHRRLHGYRRRRWSWAARPYSPRRRRPQQELQGTASASSWLAVWRTTGGDTFSMSAT